MLRSEAPRMAAPFDPMSVGQFTREFFNQKTLFVAGNTGKFDALLNVDALLAAVKAGAYETVKGGFHSLEGTHGEVRLRGEDLDSALAAGLTVAVHNVHRIHPAVSNLLRAFRTELQISDNLIATVFISPPGSGFGLHYDSASVWSLQLRGAKLWKVADQPADEFPKNHHIPTRVELDSGRLAYRPDELRERLIRTGDLLYVAPGTWHDVRSDGVSVHLSIGHYYRPMIRLLDEVLEGKLSQSPHWGRGPTRPQGDTAESRREAILHELDSRLGEAKTALGELTVDELYDAWRRGVDAPRQGGVVRAPRPSTVCERELSPERSYSVGSDDFVAAIDPSRDDQDALCLYENLIMFSSMPAASSALIYDIKVRRRFTGEELLQAHPTLDWREIGRVLKVLVEAGVVSIGARHL